MISKYAYKDLVWVDVESPTGEEVRSLMEEFGITPSAAEELLLPSFKSKVDLYENFIYLILHFPAIGHSHAGGKPNQEVDFIIGKKFIITTRYDTVDPMHKFSKVFEVNSILNKDNIGDHAGFVFYYMIRKLYRSLIHELDYLDASLSKTEEKIFKGREIEVVAELSEISRKLLDFEKATNAHREVLSSFETAGRMFFGEDFDYNLKVISGEYYKVETEIGNLRQFLNELRETNNSILSTKQNEIMKLFTIMTFIALPISLIANILGMNTVILPIVGLPYDFWIVMAIIAAFTLSMVVYFKRKGWI